MRSFRIQQLVASVVVLLDRLDVVVAEFRGSKYALRCGCLSMRWALASGASAGTAMWPSARYPHTATWRQRPASTPRRDAMRLS